VQIPFGQNVNNTDSPNYLPQVQHYVTLGCWSPKPKNGKSLKLQTGKCSMKCDCGGQKLLFYTVVLSPGKIENMAAGGQFPGFKIINT
jgi:hypothetical protein